MPRIEICYREEEATKRCEVVDLFFIESQQGKGRVRKLPFNSEHWKIHDVEKQRQKYLKGHMFF